MAQTKPKAGQFYGVSDNGTDGQFLKTDGTGGMSWDSPITNPTITSIDYPGTQTAADPAGGESVIINGTLFASGITCTVGGTSAVTAFNSATQITITTPAKAAGPYTVAVLNPDGGTASQANFIQYSGVPIWSTAAGTLGNVLEGEAASFQVTATEGSDTIEYAVTTGTLPTGLSLATATGAITGTAGSVSADTTTTFSITATDDENQTSASRSFSITVQNDPPSNHFNTVVYADTTTSVSHSVGFAPDLVWFKERNGANNHQLYDTIRGNDFALFSNTTSAQNNYATHPNGDLAPSITSTGFTTPSVVNNGINRNGGTYVAWCFKAGGAAVANTDGTINSQVSANNTLGFSIVSYTGNGVQGATVGHGLDAAPDLIIAKGIGNTGSWRVGATSLGWQYYMNLEATSQANVASSIWNSTTPTSSVFSLGNNPDANGSTQTKIAYCFTSKPGFSKVGSYTATGSAGTPIVQTGFKPAFVMVKNINKSQEWIMIDDKRNDGKNSLLPNSASAENTAGDNAISLYANGFAIAVSGSGVNYQSGDTFIYLAIAADGSTATPSLANSFDTELYTGNGGTQSITGTGFKPDLTWIKERNSTSSHSLADSVRGVGNILQSNLTDAEVYVLANLTTFDSNGFTIGASNGVNENGKTYVSWNWKAGDTPSINTDGTITSLVSANQSAGFSVVKWDTTSAAAWNVGHGLGTAPELIISKMYTFGNSWEVYHEDLGTGKYLQLSTTGTASTEAGAFSSVTDTTWTSYTTNTLGSYIAYCFHSVAGYSKVGSYTGTGASGNSIVTGFEPTFVMWKAAVRPSGGGSWYIYDNKRTTSNPQGEYLQANEPAAGGDGTSIFNIDFNANGFTINGTNNEVNQNGSTYIYLAIKEN